MQGRCCMTFPHVRGVRPGTVTASDRALRRPAAPIPLPEPDTHRGRSLSPTAQSTRARSRMATPCVAILATPTCHRPSQSASLYLVHNQETPPRDLTAWEKILLAEYQEVCKSHSGITDFRAKLLALLPIASGAGIGLLVIQGKDQVSSIEGALLIGLGIFGAIVTVGLFLYELRQIDICKQLRNHAAWIEQKLDIEAGQFGGRRQRLSLCSVYSPKTHRQRDESLGTFEKDGQPSPQEERQSSLPWKQFISSLPRRQFIGAEAAGYLIYHAVAAAWLFVAVLGLVRLI
jgi:hypothetical protein